MKKLIICPNSYHNYLIKELRKTDPLMDFKILSKKELVSRCLGEVNFEGIAYLINECNFPYSYAVKIASYLPYIDDSKTYDSDKLNSLVKYKKDLVSAGFFEKDAYFEQFLKDRDIEILGYSVLDKELNYVLSNINASYSFIENNSVIIPNIVTIHQSVSEEVLNVLNQIASLIDGGVDVQDIYIYCSDDSYNYYFNKFNKDFGFAINLPSNVSKKYEEFSNLFLKSFIENNYNFEATYSSFEDSEHLNEMKEIINSSILNVDIFNNNPKSFEILEDILKKKKCKYDLYDKAVNYISGPANLVGKYIFVVGFNKDFYPKNYADNEYLPDLLKELTYLNTSIISSSINKELLLKFFNSNNHFYFSFARSSFDSKHELSYMAKELNLTEIEGRCPEGLYSPTIASFYLNKALDQKLIYNQFTEDFIGFSKLEIPSNYASFNNNFVPFKIFSENSPLALSYSSAKSYRECPFKYYLSKVIGLDPFEGSFASNLGSLAHKMFEFINNDNLDFDMVFDKEASKFEFSEKEKLLLNQLKHKIKTAFDAAQLQKKYIENCQIYTEKYVEMKISENTTVKGIIDKTIFFGNDYFVLIDYKTGSESFDWKKAIEEMESMQMPTYALLSSAENTLFENKQLAGLFINNVINNSFNSKQKDTDLIPEHLRLNGYFLNDIDVLNKFDATFSTGSSSFAKSLSLKADGNFKSSSKIKGPTEFITLKMLAKDYYLSVAEGIRKNDFEIKPNSNDACKYCTFKDICFHRQLIIVEEEEKEND